MNPLQKSNRLPQPTGPVVQIIMDGVGIASPGPGNAVAAAFTPTLDWLQRTCPFLSVAAHGTAVGLPSDDDMGNSEVGHNALGAGRVFDQGAKLVNRAIENESLFEGDTWRALVAQCKGGTAAGSGGKLHFIGLLSDGNVHSHILQLFALLDRAAADGVRGIRVHPLLDGRDVGERSALQYLDQLEERLSLLRAAGVDASVASGGGRMVTTMDRYEADWRIVERGWNAHVHGQGRPFPSARKAVETMYADDAAATDQFLPAFVIVDAAGAPVGPIVDGDGVIFFNFRGDRAIEISRAFTEKTLDKFDRGRVPEVMYAGMMEYDGDLHIPPRYLVSPPAIAETLGEYLAHAGLRSYATAETQKYGHVTYFWNGNRSGRFSDELETYVEIPSDLVPFEQRPWMKSAEVCDGILAAIASGKHDYIRANFANGDMVGHTGVFRSATVAIESVDLALSRIIPAVKKAGGVLIVTADHGNADEMFMTKKGKVETDAAGEPVPKTAHTLNPVMYLIYDPAGRWTVDADVTAPGIGNNAATVLNLLGFEAPENYLHTLVRPA
ncbi:2,3-bisphosphoglycerate-independent phosphoglycerate mutase [Myxococcota bacterium]|nr:2,3-bisphosphoglycerate-independent phosphoglycerate mutase [Myxococcota bacterium]